MVLANPPSGADLLETVGQVTIKTMFAIVGKYNHDESNFIWSLMPLFACTGTCACACAHMCAHMCAHTNKGLARRGEMAVAVWHGGGHRAEWRNVR